MPGTALTVAGTWRLLVSLPYGPFTEEKVLIVTVTRDLRSQTATLVPLSMFFPLMRGLWPGHLLYLVGVWWGQPSFPRRSPELKGALSQAAWEGVAPKPPCVAQAETQAPLAPSLSLPCIPRREEDCIRTNGFQGLSRSGPQRARERASHH